MRLTLTCVLDEVRARRTVRGPERHATNLFWRGEEQSVRVGQVRRRRAVGGTELPTCEEQSNLLN